MITLATIEQESMLHRLHYVRSLHRHLRNKCSDTGEELKELNEIFNEVMEDGQRIEASLLVAEKKDGKIRVREKVKIVH